MTTPFDSANAPTDEPNEMVIGDFVQWKRTDLTKFDNSLYTLTYSFRSASTSAAEIEVTATADGNDFLVQIPSATTALWTKSPTYYWQAYITRISDSSRVTIDSGVVKLVSNFAEDGTDPRSHAKIMLDKIESLMEGRADDDVDNYAIAGRSITKMSVDELLNWRSFYRGEVQSELDDIARRDGKPVGSSIQLRFK